MLPPSPSHKAEITVNPNCYTCDIQYFRGAADEKGKSKKDLNYTVSIKRHIVYLENRVSSCYCELPPREVRVDFGVGTQHRYWLHDVQPYRTRLLV